MVRGSWKEAAEACTDDTAPSDEHERGRPSAETLQHLMSPAHHKSRLAMLIIVFAIIVAIRLYYLRTRSNSVATTPLQQTPQKKAPANTHSKDTLAAVPVIAWNPPAKDWEIWIGQRLTDYEKECHRLLEDYSRMLETLQADPRQATSAAGLHLLERRWRNVLTRLPPCMAQQQATLEDLLRAPVPYRLALPSSSSLPVPTHVERQPKKRPPPVDPSSVPPLVEEEVAHPVRLPPTVVPEAAYDSLNQVLAHLVRDWSSEGHTIRESLYGWCQARVREGMVDGRNRQRHHQRQGNNVYRILVPGAGLGRLAYDISNLRGTDEANGVATMPATTRVHAVELSWTMVALATTLLSSAGRRWTIYPYLNDFWTNEISSERRFQNVTIPDVTDLTATSDCLSWTVADFCELSKLSEEAASYNMIVTCFFVDTATNILDYVDGMERLLRPGGRWINLGPLHWHVNTRLVLTVEDLRALLEELGWEILQWSVDAEPLEYRSITFQDGQATSTRYEAYRPLRFVVQRPN